MVGLLYILSFRSRAVKRRLHQHISVGELQKGVAENGVGAGAVETGGIIVVLLDISVITTQAFRR